MDDEDTAASKEKAELKKALIEEFDTDGDGKISSEETPSAEQLKKFTTRRREKPKVDRLDNKRKSRMEAESAVKSAMRELEEARLREEMTVREELEAHKATLDKIRRGREQCDEEIAKLNKPINRVGKKPRLLLPNYVRNSNTMRSSSDTACVPKRPRRWTTRIVFPSWKKNFTVCMKKRLIAFGRKRKKTGGVRRKANKLMSVICSE